MKGNGQGRGLATRPQQEVEIVTADGEVLDVSHMPTALESITRAEIDTQIATAKRYPRSMQRFLQEARGIVALDPDLAAQCTYVLKDKRKQDGSPVDGPSVRLAEICALTWGNLRINGRIVDDDGKMVTAQAVGIDLEKNVGYSVEVKRGVLTRKGERFSDDMIRVTMNAAIAIATRNVTYKLVPMAMVSMIQDEAQRVARGDIKTLPERRDAALSWFAGKGVPEARVYEALGINGPGDMTLDTLMTLQGYRTAVKEGHQTLDEIFTPRPEPSASIAVPGETQTEAVKRMLKPEPNPTPVKAEPPKKPREPGEEG